ncbi:MAG: phosphoglucosamine mutase [Syntrophaceae bacterium]|nr:phosphoglucosamine mutase [Syntrophaceae bacterium]
MGKLFGTDGVRGRVNEPPMTADMALAIGRATACLFRRAGHTSHIIVGKDTRLSGDMVESAIVAGICSMGVHVTMAGVIPTPAVSFLTANSRADAGIMISASHNPYYDNGIKIFSGNGRKLPDDMEETIEQMILKDEFKNHFPVSHELGKATVMDDARGRYIAFLQRTFPQDQTLEGMKIILDCAHGATYRVAPDTFTELEAEVKTLFHEPDGRNINLECGSQHPEHLAEAVIREGADCGFAFDGDGDRVIAVDEKGNVLTGDQSLAICARSMKAEGLLVNNLVVRTVMSNIGLTLALRNLEIDYAITDVGDRYVLEEMLARGAVLGGEDSGHLIFLQHHTTGDGILSALQVLAAMRKAKKPLSELASIMTVYPQVLMNVETKSRPDLATIPAIRQAIAEAQMALGDRGRVLVRYSGTQNLCRVMVEGPTREDTERHCENITNVVRAELG